MKNESYSTSFLVDQSPQAAFDAINNVRAWWTGQIEGSSKKLGDEFTYRYEKFHYSKQKLVEFVPNKKVVWLVVEAQLNFVGDKTEWDGTKVVFDVSKKGAKTEVRFTHEGLKPKLECFGGCSDAWGSYINGSLRQLIEGGKGQSGKKEKKSGNKAA